MGNLSRLQHASYTLLMCTCYFHLMQSQQCTLQIEHNHRFHILIFNIKHFKYVINSVSLSWYKNHSPPQCEICLHSCDQLFEVLTCHLIHINMMRWKFIQMPLLCQHITAFQMSNNAAGSFSRCRIWVENCRRADLEAKTADQLNKHYRLCAKHFDPAMVCKTVSIPHNSSQQPVQHVSTYFPKMAHLKFLFFRAPIGLY